MNAFTFVLAALLLVIGVIGDRWGHRRVVMLAAVFICLAVDRRSPGGRSAA